MIPRALGHAPRALILAAVFLFVAAYFAVRFPHVPGASAGSCVFAVLIALPSFVALWQYLGARRAVLAFISLSLFGYAIETTGVVTGFPYGEFSYGDSLGPRLFGLVPWILPVSYVPLVIGAVAACGSRTPLRVPAAALLLTAMDAVLDPGALSLGFWVWPEGGFYYGVPLGNYLGWLFSGVLAAALLLAAAGSAWRDPPAHGLLDSAILGLSFWTGVVTFSGLIVPTLLGLALFSYLLRRRSSLRRANKDLRRLAGIN